VTNSLRDTVRRGTNSSGTRSSSSSSSSSGGRNNSSSRGTGSSSGSSRGGRNGNHNSSRRDGILRRGDDEDHDVDDHYNHPFAGPRASSSSSSRSGGRSSNRSDSVIRRTSRSDLFAASSRDTLMPRNAEPRSSSSSSSRGNREHNFRNDDFLSHSNNYNDDNNDDDPSAFDAAGATRDDDPSDTERTVTDDGENDQVGSSDAGLDEDMEDMYQKYATSGTPFSLDPTSTISRPPTTRPSPPMTRIASSSSSSSSSSSTGNSPSFLGRMIHDANMIDDTALTSEPHDGTSLLSANLLDSTGPNFGSNGFGIIHPSSGIGIPSDSLPGVDGNPTNNSLTGNGDSSIHGSDAPPPIGQSSSNCQLLRSSIRSESSGTPFCTSQTGASSASLGAATVIVPSSFPVHRSPRSETQTVDNEPMDIPR